jgi:hypothetical protein
MGAVIAAIIAALLGFLARIAYDVWVAHEGRKAIAAALAGELRAYLQLSNPEHMIDNLRKCAQNPHAERIVALKALPPMPSGHPVFDRVADRIGTLSPEAARGVSEAYNIMTSGRMLLTHMSAPAFLDAPDHVQQIQIGTMIDIFSRETDEMRRTVELLDRLSRQTLWCRLTGYG